MREASSRVFLGSLSYTRHFPPPLSRREKRNNLIEEVGIGIVGTKFSYIHETHFDRLRSADENCDRIVPMCLADNSDNRGGRSLGHFL